jgi:cation diffusion facilitator family transporter
MPANERFPFGHGKEVYFWSFVVAIMIFAVGAGVSIYKGVHHLLHPTTIQNPYLNYVVLGVALIRGKDPTMFVVLFEDSAAMLGIIVAFLGIFLSQITMVPYYDGIASIIIGLILAGTAAWLAYETKGLLIGESARPELVKGVIEIAKFYPKIQHVNEVLTLHMGPDFILLNLSVDFDDTALAGEVEEAIAKLDSEIKQAYPKIKRIFVEAFN